MLSEFREMVNEATRICLDENIKGRLNLRNRLYKELQDRHGMVSCYPYSVAEVAWSIVKKHRRWQRRPYAKRLMMKMDSRNYSLNFGIISLPFRKGERVLIPLQYGDYQRSFLMDETLKKGSVTLTESEVIIAFAKEVSPIVPVSRLGVDLNERSAVCSDGTKYDLSEVSRLHTEYGVRRRDFYEKHSNDRRLKKKFASSRREKERVRQSLHDKAKRIVEAARMKHQSIVLEELKGIRHVHQKRNGESRGKRRRIAQWPFRVLQTFILYKAQWSGVPVEFVGAAWTSKTCHKCGYVNRRLKLTEREWLCPSCGATLDRDYNAAVNIRRRGKIPCLGGVVPPGAQGTDEAVKGNERSMAPILRAEAPKGRVSTCL